LSSDALIHDCGSFIIEYLYTKKPCLFLVSQNRLNECNTVSQKAFEVHHHAFKSNEIEEFIEQVVLNNNDSKMQEREQFYKDVLLPPNNLSVTENIVNDLKTAINKI
jgi:CDP-glycerol glycerophosphotransferase (TagB/SpsB family)